MTIIQLLSLLIIGTIPILFAAVQPWVWSLYCLLMIAAFILFLWMVRVNAVFPRIDGQKKLISLFFIWTIFLCIPFPHAALSFLSPRRSEILSQAWSLTSGSPTWQTVSYSPKSALAWWVFLLSLGLFFIVIRNLCTKKKILKRLIFVLIGIGLIEAIYGLIQALVPSMGVLWIDYVEAYLGTARGTFINRNNFAGFIEMIWPLALGVTLSMTGQVRSFKELLASDRLNRQALMAICIIVFLLALMLTRSRAGIFSSLIGFLTFSKLARTGMKVVAKQTRLLLIGIVILFSIYAMAIGIEPIMERFLTIRGDGNTRVAIWRDSLPIIKDHPLGIGLRNYKNVFQVYNRSFTSDKTVIFAHSDYLQLLIETGWIGFIAIVGGFFIFLAKRARRIRQFDFRRDPLRFYLAVGAFSGLISIAVHSLIDFNLQIPANCVYFVVLMAILSACTRPYRQSPRVTDPPVLS